MNTSIKEKEEEIKKVENENNNEKNSKSYVSSTPRIHAS